MTSVASVYRRARAGRGVRQGNLPRSSALFGLKLTFGGIVSLAVIGTMGVAGLSNDANLLFLLFGIAVGVVACNLIAPILMVRKLEVERLLPDAVVAGRPFKIVYLLRSRRRWLNAVSLVVTEKTLHRSGPALPQVFVPFLHAGAQQRIEMVARLPNRGRIPLVGVRITSRFPFGIFSCSVDFGLPGDLFVYPALGRFRSDPWKDHRFSGTAQNRQHHVGQEEFYGVREYRPGDNLHWIHWRRSARTGQLVVREMMSLSPTQLLVLLDPWPAGVSAMGVRDVRDADELAERLISAAATALCEGLERGQRVGLICRARVPIIMPPASGPQHRHRLLQELAMIAPPGGEALDALLARSRSASGWHARYLVCATRFTEQHQLVLKFLAGRAEAVVLLSPESENFEASPELARPVKARAES